MSNALEISKRLLEGDKLLLALAAARKAQPSSEVLTIRLLKNIAKWLSLMSAFYSAGGSGCARGAAGGDCTTMKWTHQPLCWFCATGAGNPPEPTMPTDGLVGIPAATPASSPLPPATGGMVMVGMSAVGHCRRRVAYRLFKMPETNPRKPEWDVVAAAGNLLEPLLVKWLKARGLEVANVLDKQEELTIDVTPKLRFRGHPDGDVRRPGRPWGNLELKCLSAARSDYIKDTSVLSAVPDYYGQMQMYMMAKGQANSLLVVLNRNTGEINKFVVPANGFVQENLVWRWEEVSELLAGGELPPPDYTGSAFECLVCVYKSSCPAYQHANKPIVI